MAVIIWLLHQMLVQVLRRVVIWADQILSRDIEILEMVCRVQRTRTKWTITPLRILQVDSHRWLPIIHLRATSLAIKVIEVAGTPQEKMLKTFHRYHLNIRTLRNLPLSRISIYLNKQMFPINKSTEIQTLLQTLKMRRQWGQWATRAIASVVMRMKKC